MRDIVVTAIVFGSVPFILKRPWIGILMWCWISYMNPHRLAWGFAINMPFALVIALATLTGMLLSREPKRIPWTRETITLGLFLIWTVVTTLYALNPEGAWVQLSKVAKIQLMTFVTLMLITTKERLNPMIWVIVMSIAFYGVKGGIFTILNGGAFRVWGPAGSFIAGNNEIALAITMVIPLMRYLDLSASQVWLRWPLRGMMLLIAIAAIGSQSRGGFLAMGAMGIFLWLKSRNKAIGAVLLAAAVLAILAIMPPEYYARLNTIQSYEQDPSAMGRINAWWVAWNVAVDRPLVGGGYDMFTGWVFGTYAPNPDDFHDVHSIYFEVLGHHGFVGLGLFLMLWAFTWRTASKVAKLARQAPEHAHLSDLVLMVQTSLIGYAVGGAFLGLAYFDLPYHLMTMVVISKMLIDRASKTTVANLSSIAPPMQAGFGTR